MFDLGFGELLLIAVVALIVLGPERLPKAARFAGLWVRRARAQWHSVRAELERELEAEELKRSLHDTQAALKQAQLRLQDEVGQAQQQLQDEVGQVQAHLQDPPVTTAQPLDALDAPPADATPANPGGTPPAGTDDEPERR
jgi:sec-independent protein translocase protein TatB